jgi:hypothetical protein
MSVRGIASKYYRGGATGMYVFNWHADSETRRENMTQIGSTDTLRRTDKIFAATNRYILNEGEWRGAYRRDRILGEVPVALKPTLTGDGPTIRLDIADDLVADPPTTLQLRLRFSEWVDGDKVTVQFNSDELSSPEITYGVAYEPLTIGDVGPDVWYVFDIEPAQVALGTHHVKVILAERHPQVASDLVLTDVELAVTY